MRDLRFAEDHGLLALRHFGFRFDGIDRRRGADFDAGARVAQRLARQLERLALDVERGDGEGQVPVGVADRSRRQRDRLPQRDVGNLPVLLRDEQLLARRVDAETRAAAAAGR